VANLLLLVVCFFVGALARRTRALPEDSHRAVNAWVIFVSLPALVFRSIHGVKLDAAMLLSSATLWLVFAIPAVVAWALVRRGGAREPLGAVALCAGLGNTAFVGLPLIEAVAGKDALGPAAVIDQLGSFLALFLFAIPFATVLGGGKVSFAQSLKKLTRSPAMVALVLAVVLRDVVVPESLGGVLARLADMLSPLALASIGWQLDLSALAGNGKRIAVGLTWKLVLAPLMVLGVLLLWRGQLGFVDRVVIAQAAMAPMVTAGVVAADNKLAPGLAAAMIAVGVPLSLLTVPLWWHLLA
jgi:malate permease and related proteins